MKSDQGVRARIIRTLGFCRKELLSVLRQPRLLVTLVLGPFLILLIFGLGYRESPHPFRTLLIVGDEEARVAAERADLSEAFGASIDLVGTATDVDEGMRSLEGGEVDLLIIAPEDSMATLDKGEKAVFEVVHGEVDPVVRTSIDLIARLAVDEINRRVLAEVVGTAQQETQEVDEPLADLREGSDRLVASLEDGDDPESLAEAQALNERLDELEGSLARVQGVEPQLVVSPFDVTITQVNEVSRSAGVFYSPGTLVLLVQHLTLTFAALSLVRERQLGLTEVFRVSPLAGTESLVGKYLGFGAIAAIVTAVLTLLMSVFGVEVRASVAMYSVVMALVILASLGLGFVISGLSRTDSQAVQYSMIALLVSIFFTGFVLPLDRLAEPVHVVSYMIPATYGIQALHDVIFRGVAVELGVLAGLVGYALVLGAAAWWMVRREVVARPA
jgi:ABC-2 type transport system permease protein